MAESEQNNYELNMDLTTESIIVGGRFTGINIDSVKTWLKRPMQFNKELRNASRILYNSNGIYTNTIDYMVALPTLDKIVHGKNKNHNRFKDNREKFNDTLLKMKDKRIARDIFFKVALEGISFYYFETEENKPFPKHMSDQDIDSIELNSEVVCSAIPLPTDYCRIVGTRNSSYIVAFNCEYFDQFTGKGRSKKLLRYPTEIRRAYKAYKADFNKKWAILDNDRTITVKIRSKMDERWGRPLGMAGYVDMLYDEYFVDTKRKVLDDVNSTVIYQTFPEGEKSGQSSLTTKQQKRQHDNIKSALFTKGATKGVNFFSIASGTKLDKLTTNIEMLKVKGEDELINRISTSLGFAGSALNGQGGSLSGQKSNLELVSSELFSWQEQIQEEFNKVINANIINDSKTYIEVYYMPITHVNRKDMIRNMKELYTHGGGSLIAWISSTGMSSDAYLSLLDYEKEEGFTEKYPPNQTAFTQTNKDGVDQKPINDDSDNENTMKNKNNGSNPVE
ncbi:hypothetical protein JOC34_000457 [Virgibacillus halotolerans]|uniref:hypothetical protein n=1 Tax=Virgibacillus halotolerans TaxID=1071053 RepID=UPI0019605680|nr:hypothetical protein [Virgibacillus halotolerans]MBM7598100.1 hypothetical protein [Virgibacillus halotolerans]